MVTVKVGAYQGGIKVFMLPKIAKIGLTDAEYAANVSVWL